MENRAFALVRAGRKEEAQSVLFNPEYETQKQIYAEGIMSFANQIRREFDESFRHGQRTDLLSIIAAMVVGGTSFVAWLSAARGVRRWRAQLLDSFHRRAEAEENLRKAHAELEVRVKERTAELANANEALQAENTERKRGEKALRQAEEKYRGIFENAVEGIFQTTSDGRFIAANSALARILGFDSPEELIAARTDIAQENYVDPKSREEFKRLLDENGSVLDFELEAYRRDGSRIWISENVLAVRDAKGTVVHYEGTAQDITKRKRAEDALRTSEAHLQTVVENLEEGVVVSDLKGGLLHWNRAALKLHGYSDSEQDRRRFTELVDTFELSTLDGALLPVEQWPLARILRREKVHDLELRVRRVGSDGQRILNYGGTLVRDTNNQPLMAIVTINDITERKQAENLVRASEERYRALFESNPNPMWVFDSETLSFLAVNAAAVRHYGYSQDEFLAMTIKDIRPSEDIPALMDNLSQGTDDVNKSTQWRHCTKDRTLIDVEITSHELTWLGRRAKVALINDITERKRAEE
ncbi:MAG TPA: PAS domain S-box protein, partial [Chthoniobacterales bacterium]|nr:PAS domain S-box protein [Chthoniobacterales bacterium]